MRCPRCMAWICDDVVHVSDTPDGLYVVTTDPVADYVVACRCGADIAVSSTQPTVHHPGQLTLIRGAA